MPQETLAQQACSFFLARLEAEISRLRGISFPGHDIGPRRWLNFISGVLDTGRQYLDQSRAASTAAPKAKQLLEDAETMGEQAYVFLKHVTGADATQIPHEIVAPFQRWVAGLRITNTIFFRSEHLANYELWQMDARALKNYPSASQSLLTAIGDIDWPILRVTVPGHAMDMLPHFAVVAHELGHAIQDRIKPDLSSYVSDRRSCDSRIALRLANSGVAFGATERLRVTTIFDKWLNEIKADSVGHFLVGPAFFFALFGFLELAGRSYGIADTHPPSDLRRQLLLHQLNIGTPSFLNIFQAKTSVAITETINSPNIPACPAGDTLFQELLTEYGATDAAICTELVPYLRTIGAAVFTAARDYLGQICPDLIYSPQQLDADLGDPLDMLCALVPPIESRANTVAEPEAMGLASILNIGWATLLTRLDRIPDKGGTAGLSDARRFDQLHQLLLKAVELSEARRLWSEHK
jgi:hypothetical protein